MRYNRIGEYICRCEMGFTNLLLVLIICNSNVYSSKEIELLERLDLSDGIERQILILKHQNEDIEDHELTLTPVSTNRDAAHVYVITNGTRTLLNHQRKRVTYYQDLRNGAFLAKRRDKNHEWQFYGTLLLEDQRHDLRPDKNETHRNKYKIIPTKNPSEYFDVDPPNDQEENMLNDIPRLHERRKRRNAEESIIPYKMTVSIMADHTVYNHWVDLNGGDATAAIADLEYYFSYSLNGVNMVFSYIDSNTTGYSIDIQIKEYFIYTDINDMIWSDSSLFIQIGATDRETYVAKSATLSSFKQWKIDNGWTWNDPDHAVLWTMYDIAASTTDSSAIGLAPLCGICKTHGVSLLEDTGYGSFLTIAHEIGHNVGSPHDVVADGCDPADKFLMSPSTASFHNLPDEKLSNPFRLSTCSQDYIKDCLDGTDDGYPRVCLRDEECLEDRPGAIEPLEELCDYYGQTFVAAYYDSGTYLLCEGLWCKIPNTNSYSNHGPPPLGTHCGPTGDESSKVCWEAVCIDAAAVPTTSDESSCTTMALGREVPEECYTEDKPTSYAAPYDTCSALVADYPSMCDNTPNVQEQCCYWCQQAGKMLGETCLEDFGYEATVGSETYTCDEVVVSLPQFCFIVASTQAFCCKACTEAGLIAWQDPEPQDTTTESPTTTTTEDYTTTVQTPAALEDTTDTTEVTTDAQGSTTGLIPSEEDNTTEFTTSEDHTAQDEVTTGASGSNDPSANPIIVTTEEMVTEAPPGTPTPAPSPGPSPSPSPGPTPAPSPSASSTPSAAGSPSPTPGPVGSDVTEAPDDGTDWVLIGAGIGVGVVVAGIVGVSVYAAKKSGAPVTPSREGTMLDDNDDDEEGEDSEEEDDEEAPPKQPGKAW